MVFVFVMKLYSAMEVLQNFNSMKVKDVMVVEVNVVFDEEKRM